MINATLRREARRQACELREHCLIREALGWGSCSLSLHAVREDETKDPEGEVTLAGGLLSWGGGSMEEAGHRRRRGVNEG